MRLTLRQRRSTALGTNHSCEIERHARPADAEDRDAGVGEEEIGDGGARIEDVSGRSHFARGERHGGARRLRLEPMRVEGALTYGAIEARRLKGSTARLTLIYAEAALPLPD